MSTETPPNAQLRGTEPSSDQVESADTPRERGGEAAALSTPSAGAKYETLSDTTLAYRFQYPVLTDDGRQLSWVTTREPTRYNSAAPLSSDARQRIVCEVANFKGPLTLSLTVGPPPPVLGAC